MKLRSHTVTKKTQRQVGQNLLATVPREMDRERKREMVKEISVEEQNTKKILKTCIIMANTYRKMINRTNALRQGCPPRGAKIWTT